MTKKNNRVSVVIEDCRYCPSATLKFVQEEQEDYMYCQSSRSCIQLRRGWGVRPIPDWCPRLNEQKVISEKIALPVLISTKTTF